MDDTLDSPLLLDAGSETNSMVNGRRTRLDDGVAVLCAFGASLGAVGFGYALGFSSPALPAMNGDVFHDLQCGDDDGAVTSTVSSLWSSIINVGAFIGALGGGWVLDKFGRRGTLVVWSAPFMAGGWVWTAASKGAVELVIARVIVGIGVGLASAAVPVFIAETAPARLRGGLGSLNQFAVTFGILLVYAVGYVLPHTRREYHCGDHVKSIHPSGWRLLAWIGAMIAGALFTVATVYLPETPVWLARMHRRLDAERSLLRLRNGKPDDGEISALFRPSLDPPVAPPPPSDYHRQQHLSAIQEEDEEPFDEEQDDDAKEADVMVPKKKKHRVTESAVTAVDLIRILVLPSAEIKFKFRYSAT